MQMESRCTQIFLRKKSTKPFTSKALSFRFPTCLFRFFESMSWFHEESGKTWLAQPPRSYLKMPKVFKVLIGHAPLGVCCSTLTWDPVSTFSSAGRVIPRLLQIESTECLTGWLFFTLLFLQNAMILSCPHRKLANNTFPVKYFPDFGCASPNYESFGAVCSQTISKGW